MTKLSSSGTDTYKENRQTKGEAEKTNKMTDTYKESGKEKRRDPDLTA